jgi:hypothetical protein
MVGAAIAQRGCNRRNQQVDGGAAAQHDGLAYCYGHGGGARAGRPPGRASIFLHSLQKLALSRAQRRGGDAPTFQRRLLHTNELRAAFNEVGAYSAAGPVHHRDRRLVKDVDFSTFGDLGATLAWSLVASKDRRLP